MYRPKTACYNCFIIFQPSLLNLQFLKGLNIPIKSLKQNFKQVNNNNKIVNLVLDLLLAGYSNMIIFGNPQSYKLYSMLHTHVFLVYHVSCAS